MDNANINQGQVHLPDHLHIYSHALLIKDVQQKMKTFLDLFNDEVMGCEWYEERAHVFIALCFFARRASTVPT